MLDRKMGVNLERMVATRNGAAEHFPAPYESDEALKASDAGDTKIDDAAGWGRRERRQKGLSLATPMSRKHHAVSQ